MTSTHHSQTGTRSYKALIHTTGAASHPYPDPSFATSGDPPYRLFGHSSLPPVDCSLTQVRRCLLALFVGSGKGAVGERREAGVAIIACRASGPWPDVAEDHKNWSIPIRSYRLPRSDSVEPRCELVDGILSTGVRDRQYAQVSVAIIILSTISPRRSISR